MSEAPLNHGDLIHNEVREDMSYPLAAFHVP